MYQEKILASNATPFKAVFGNGSYSDIQPDNGADANHGPIEPLVVQDCGDEEHSAACDDVCDDTRCSSDKRRTMDEMREKINNLKKQFWYNWTYWGLVASIKEGDVKVVGTAEYNEIEYPAKFNYIDDKTWALFQATARKLEEEFGRELDAVPDDIDREYLEGKLSALRYACGEEDWERLYA